jgi:hypothetical protein
MTKRRFMTLTRDVNVTKHFLLSLTFWVNELEYFAPLEQFKSCLIFWVRTEPTQVESLVISVCNGMCIINIDRLKILYKICHSCSMKHVFVFSFIVEGSTEKVFKIQAFVLLIWVEPTPGNVLIVIFPIISFFCYFQVINRKQISLKQMCAFLNHF